MQEQIPFIKYHNVWKCLVSDKVWDETYYKGFQVRNAVTPYTGGDYMAQTDEVTPVSDGGSRYLEKIRTLCEENGSSLLLVSTPSPDNYNYAIHNGIEVCAGEKGVDYLDLNLLISEIGLDWNTDALDGGDHLNRQGGEKMSSYFGQYLAEHYRLTDHRDDEAFSDWKELAETYEETKTTMSLDKIDDYDYE